MELIGLAAGLIFLAAGFYMQNRPSGSYGAGWIFIFAFIFYFSQWLVAVCGLLWLNRAEIIDAEITVMTGILLGFLIGIIDFSYCFLSEAKTPEEQIGGAGLAVICFFFSLFFGAIFGTVASFL